MHHQHYITEAQNPPTNPRPQQQASPSDSNSNSMSTASPPHRISRGSPASTALVMSSTNINGVQASSRQLTPNTSSSNNGTGSSSNGNSGQLGAPSNPMVRQFACHAKSMSAGGVVPVPGIFNHLASVTGMNQNNMVNGSAATANNHHGPHDGRNHTVNNNLGMLMEPSHHTGTSYHIPSRSSHIHHYNHHQAHTTTREHRTNHHHSHSHHYNQHNQYHHNQESNSQFFNPRQGSSSIILSNTNINNIHNRSASNQLPSVVLNHNLGNLNSNSHSNNHISSNSRSNFPSHATTNSIWSIGENISKSHGKLAASSGYLTTHPHHYLFNPSVTGISCDNVSNASRMIDNAPAPGYYLHHTSPNLPNSNGLSVSGSIKAPEFLPICDLMFNLISMIIYFCENTFGIIALIALYYHAVGKHWALVGTGFVLCSNIICQYLSFKWMYKGKLEDCVRKKEAQEELEEEENCERRYYNRMAANMRNYQCGSCTWLPDSATEVQLKFLLSIVLDAIMHLFCLGFLVRYIKLVIPVTDTARVKVETRDLCILRMIHGFIQSVPLLLLQNYMIFSQTSSSAVISLSVTSAVLSLVNVSWGLASFTKYARKKYMHKFVLTWLGILSQFMWRLGTVSSRIMALTIYAVCYNYWMFVALLFHWMIMFFWIINTKNTFRDEAKLSPAKRVSYAMATAWIHCFCYVNFDEHNSILKMISYYLIVFIENTLLLTVCLIVFSPQVTWFKNVSIMVVYLGLFVGILFMLLYYKYFHVTVLTDGLSRSQESVDSIADQLSAAGKKIAGFKPGTLRLKSEDGLSSKK